MGKTLIILRGLHNKDLNNKGPIDWKQCYTSLYEKFITYLDKDYDIYFQTYDSPELNELLNVYKPIKYLSYPINDINKHTQVENIYKLIEIVDNIEQYDQIFITRFDILYKISLDKWKIKIDNINVFFKHPNGDINDTIFLLYSKNIINFISKIQNHSSKKNLHKIKFENLHSMDESRYYSDTDYPEYFPLNNNPYYILHRTRRWGFKDKKTAYEEAKKTSFYKIIINMKLVKENYINIYIH